MKKISILIASAILFLSPLQTFASSWTTYKYNNQSNPVVFDASSHKSTPGYYIPIGQDGAVVADPVVSDGILFYVKNYSSIQSSELVAASIDSGTTIWSKTYNRNIQRLIYNNGKLFFGSGIIYCLDANSGSTIWTADKDLSGNIITTSRVYRVDSNIIYANEVHGATGDSEAIILDINGQAITNLNHFRTTYLNDVLIDNLGLYFVDIGKTGTAGSIAKYDKSSRLKIWGIDIPNGMASFLDIENDRIYVTKGYRLMAFNSINGQKIFEAEGVLENGFAKYGGKIYGFNGSAVKFFDADETQGNIDGQTAFTLPEKFSSSPLIINDTIYGGSTLGRLWGKNLETGEENIWPVGGSGGYIHSLVYADGKLIVINRLAGTIGTRLYVMDINDLSLRPNDYTVTLDSPYKTDGDYQPLLGQLHAHYIPDYDLSSIYAGWNKTPIDVANRYLDEGYNFIAITEHDAITQNLNIPNILDINYSEEDTEAPSKHHILAIGISSQINENDSDQNRVNQINEQGGLAFLAHPNANVYSESMKQLLDLNGYLGLEIFNSGVNKWYLVAGEPYALDKWDNLLAYGKNIWATSGDDYTPWDGGFDGGAVVVFSKTKTQPDIMQNLKDGNFYALQGSQAPRIDVNVSGNQITINSDKQSKIKFIGNGGKTLQQIDGVFSANYVATGNEIYVRAEVEANGKSAWTQPISVSKTRVSQTLTSGEHYINLGQASLASNTTDTVNASVLSSFQYPNQSPPLGYFSPIYSFSTSGQVLEGTNLSISYANRNIFTNEDNLAIYTYDEANSIWNKITSYVDKVNKIVSANLSHYSLYTLSAEQPEDMEIPTISLASPADLTNLSGQINFEANASDNNAVTEVRFFVDDKLITKDTNISDGWKTEIDANDFATGSHKLKLEAEDFAGNVGSFETNFTITDSTFVSPTVLLLTPANEQYLKDKLTISGNYSSQNEVKNISVYLNDIFLADADFTDGTYQKEIDFGQFKEGKHSLKVILTDIKDNIVETTTTINVGDELKVSIVSPQNKTYLRSKSILFQYQTTPANVDGVVAKIDGIEIANNTTKNAYELALGQHTYTVEKNGKVYAEMNFIISTNLADQIKLTEAMYKTGHIKNRGITTAIQVRLALAQLLDRLGMKNLRDLVIQQTIKFIDQQNKQKKSLIDDYARELLVTDLNHLLTR